MSASISDNNLERKFASVSNTQDSIQSLSLWIIHHKNHAKKIVDVWMKVLKKAKVSQRLTLFYLTNDVIQNSKRKGTTLFLEAFQNALPEAAILLKDEQIRGSVQRVLKIWEQRTIYSPEFIDELNSVLNNNKTITAAVSKIVAEFKPESAIEKIRQAVVAENETAKKLQALNSTKFDAANSEILRQFKDRKHGQQFSKDFEDATRCLEEYIIALEKDLTQRKELIQILEQAEIYYDTQRGEARIVSNAYKSFSTRVSAQKKRLEEIIKNLPSPFPSPCADAPSPTNSEELPDFSAVVPKETASPVESVPSPEGTPEDLRLSPPIGDPSQGVPQTVSSFMPQAGMMAFWLEAFQTGSPAAPAQEQKSSSSLDSRLMNLMHKIPNKVPPFLEQKGIFPLGGDETPVKDEHSGQETPVQDESNTNLKGAKTTLNNKSHPEGAGINKVKEASQMQKSDSVPNNKNTPNSETNSKWKTVAPQNGTTKAQEEKKDSFIEPLKPPPMPNFDSFSFLDSPTLNSGSLPAVNNAMSKSRTDPRLNSHNYKTNSKDGEQSDSLQGVDDTEIMDMELEDSDEEEEGGTLDPKKQKDGVNPKSGESSFSPILSSLSQPSSHTVSSKQSNSVNNVNNKQLNSSKEDNGHERLTTPVINTGDCTLAAKKGSSLLDSPVTKEFDLKSDSIEQRLKELQKTRPLIQESSLLDSPVQRNDGDGTRDVRSASISSYPQHLPPNYDVKDFRGGRMENAYKLANRGFSRIETIQTLRNEEWGAAAPAWDMDITVSENNAPSYDYEQVPYTQPSMPYHMPPEGGDFDYRYNNGSSYPNQYDNGVRKYHSHPDKRFPQRPFRRGRRGYFNKQY